MSRIMFIDGSHREQIRVAVTEKGRVTEFDIESFDKKQTIGNIYLAKIMRVEPSLQAAFVEYGSGRQGFLSFSEIHPDYYQIPLEDRKRLLEEAAAFYNHDNDDDDIDNESLFDDMLKDVIDHENHTNSDAVDLDIADIDDDTMYQPHNDNTLDVENDLDISDEAEDDSESNSGADSKKSRSKKPRLPRYKIQEVIKKRQILLVQVIKSERGNKGAALTTYLSLAGRYCVLMPNTARGGGISRKITNIADRQKLRSTIKEFQLPTGMGLIVRTAGLQRTTPELRRDYEYLLRLWDNVRQLTMSSIAPALVYEEGDLIKRALRDIYTRDTSKIFVQGEEVYKEARDIMKMIMPSVVRFIHHYQDPLPLFSRYQIERQLDELSLSEVTLKSGGYLVINHTEALIAIDVNSGKSTNSYSIEETALRTNLEAGEEIARQLRLRDLAGLIVIDFIDMEDSNNVRTIERKMREFLKPDKARLQTTHISAFGLMEMTRQRLRPAMKDLMSVPCSHCHGMGFVPSLETSALRVLRAIFEEISQKPLSELTLTCSIDIAHYLLNKKRKELLAVENEYELIININGSTKCAHLEYTLDSELKDPVKITRTPRIYQEEHYEEQVFDEDTEANDEQKDDAIIHEHDAPERGRNSKNRRSKRTPPKEPKALIPHATDDSEAPVDKPTPTKRPDGRHDSRRSKFSRNRSRFYDKTSFEVDVYVTASGNQVIIENASSVRHPVEKPNTIETAYDTDNSTPETHAPETHAEAHIAEVLKPEVLKNVIVENRISVKVSHTHHVQKAVQQDYDDVINDIRESPVKEAITEVIKETENDIKLSIDSSILTSETIISTDESAAVCEDQKPARRGWWRNRFGL